jgi:predicted TPR repeat methyltransferase
MLEKTYNELAEKYDTMYKDPVCLAEDKALFDYLTRQVPLFKSVLDLGCGTGLLLENLMIAANNYVGLDPSDKSIDIARKKFPLYAKKFNVSKCNDKFFGTFENRVKISYN